MDATQEEIQQTKNEQKVYAQLKRGIITRREYFDKMYELTGDESYIYED
jgi:hypothetical protein